MTNVDMDFVAKHLPKTKTGTAITWLVLLHLQEEGVVFRDLPLLAHITGYSEISCRRFVDKLIEKKLCRFISPSDNHLRMALGRGIEV